VVPGTSAWVAREVAIGLCWRWVLASDPPPRPSDRNRKVSAHRRVTAMATPLAGQAVAPCSAPSATSAPSTDAQSDRHRIPS
jgi:hypothetical protein